MLVNNEIGFMQGRLTEKGGFYPQEFPWRNWEREFYTAKDMGFDCMEWMFNEDNWIKNPIFLINQLPYISEINQRTNIRISGICANYFMRKSIFSEKKCEQNSYILNTLLKNSQLIGCRNIIIPLFEESEIQLNNSFFFDMIDELNESDVFILFESNVSLSILKEWLTEFKRNKIGICYDLGNAVGEGYDSVSELKEYGEIVKNVHLKDKKSGGNTVMIGEGDVQFEECFEELNKYSYSGSYILESYYYEAVKDTYRNLKIIKEIMK